MPSAIQIERLSKRYRLGERLRYHTLRETLANRWRKGWKRSGAAGPEILWALRDVSFGVDHGEVVGIIGRNGAGKSTLLKILSRITEPTEGRVVIRGRVGSLLEVGTGFHPELTGRENIFLNGAILGMRQAEIRQKFDEIVGFAEVEDFLDTPVKRYSSGMYVRLAFAVAAHLEPEILLVDEVLAVGDIGFQRKCLGKMSDVARSGRTVLFVSHNMAAVESLCSRAILLEKGQVHTTGSAEEVIRQYVRSMSDIPAEQDLTDHPARVARAAPILKSWRVLDARGEPVPSLALGEDSTFEVRGDAPRRIRAAALHIQINRPTGERIATCYTNYQYDQTITLEGPFVFRCVLRNCRLMPGPYVINLSLTSSVEMLDCLENLPCEVTPRDIYGTGKVLPPRCGPYLPDVTWTVEGACAP